MVTRKIEPEVKVEAVRRMKILSAKRPVSAKFVLNGKI